MIVALVAFRTPSNKLFSFRQHLGASDPFSYFDFTKSSMPNARFYQYSEARFCLKQIIVTQQ